MARRYAGDDSGARAGDGRAARAAVGVALRCFSEIDTELVGQRRQPGQYIAELVHLLFVRALANRLRQFADLFRQPGDRARDAADPVALTERRFDLSLKSSQVHAGAG